MKSTLAATRGDKATLARARKPTVLIVVAAAAGAGAAAAVVKLLGA